MKNKNEELRNASGEIGKKILYSLPRSGREPLVIVVVIHNVRFMFGRKEWQVSVDGQDATSNPFWVTARKAPEFLP